jgi:anti-sigma B factor antagonist
MHDAPLSYALVSGKQPGTSILKLVGPLTLYNIFAFQDYLRSVDSAVLILDMTGVSYMDSAGLGLLMNGYVSAQHNGRKFILAGVNDRVNALLQMTRLDQVLSIYPSAEAAETAI